MKLKNQYYISYENKLHAGLRDIFISLLNWRLWIFLGWIDIRSRYKRSSLGPLWITLSMIIFVLALSIVYSRLFHQPVRTYLPFLFCGFLLWNFMSTNVIESSEVYRSSQSFIQTIKIPFMTYILRQFCRNTIIFMHNIIVYVFVVFYSAIHLNGYLLLLIPAFLLVTINLLWVCVLVSILGTRFRDIPPIVMSLVQVVFFISPITWTPDQIGVQSKIILFNPLFYYMDLVRSPMLGHPPLLLSWIVSVGTCLAGSSLALYFFVNYRQRIPFWV